MAENRLPCNEVVPIRGMGGTSATFSRLVPLSRH